MNSKSYAGIVIAIIFLGTCSCKPRRIMQVYSPLKDQCITIFSHRNQQFIVSGNFDRIPDSNYVIIDISQSGGEAEALNVCWTGTKGWYAVIHGVEILNYHLDSNFYVFSNRLPENRGIPSESLFRNLNCATISFDCKTTTPPSNTTVVID